MKRAPQTHPADGNENGVPQTHPADDHEKEAPQTHPADDHDDTGRHEWQDVLQVVVAVLVLEDGDDHGARQQQEGAEFLWDLGVEDENGVEGEDGAEEIAESQSAVIHDAQLVHVVGVARVVKLQNTIYYSRSRQGHQHHHL